MATQDTSAPGSARFVLVQRTNDGDTELYETNDIERMQQFVNRKGGHK